jgi:hypothetical protein
MRDSFDKGHYNYNNSKNSPRGSSGNNRGQARNYNHNRLQRFSFDSSSPNSSFTSNSRNSPNQITVTFLFLIFCFINQKSILKNLFLFELHLFFF